MKTQSVHSLAMSMALWDASQSQAFVPSFTPAGRSGVFRRSIRDRITTGTDATFLMSTRSTTGLKSKAPSRFEDNVEGVLYVNEACINCQACNRFAPSVFHMDENRQSHHVVYHQPDVTNKEEMDQARAALSACPVAAIRVDQKEAKTTSDKHTRKQLTINEKVSGWTHPFPRVVDDAKKYPNVYHLGHHNEHSFGAVPYLAVGAKDKVMVDTPKFNKSAVRTVESLTGREGPSYMFLTHVDDTADHDKWAEHFPSMKRIFHSGDLGADNWRGDLELENCEVILHGTSDYGKKDHTTLFKAWKLNGEDYPDFESSKDDNEEFVVLHTPGHSRGSITLLQRPQNGEQGGIIYTGDTLGRTGRTGELTAFPRYGNNLRLQKQTLEHFAKLSTPWDFIAPGHGIHRLYHGDMDLRNKELEGAVQELASHAR